MSNKVRVLHIITDLDPDGAQTMLYRLLSQIDTNKFDTEVISLTGNGLMRSKIQELGVPIRSMGMSNGLSLPLAVIRLALFLRQSKPQVIQTWMYHADLVGGLAAKLAGIVPVAWGIHHTDYDPQLEKRSVIWLAKACALLSQSLPASIVCCSEATRKIHREMGYATDKLLVIPNGFDLTAFKPDPIAADSVRRDLGISHNVPLIGLVARFHPQKDHHNFIQAASRLSDHHPQSNFILCGSGITWDNPDLVTWIDAAGISQQCHLLGQRDDIPRLMTAFDIASTSSSYGEAFPLVIGEAMASGVPCVVTDVGDSRLIVGQTGVVVPPRDPEALADGWRQLLSGASREERLMLGLDARRRIRELYSLVDVVEQYSHLYLLLSEN